MAVCLSVCPSVFVITFEVPFKRLFTPTSQNRMSNMFIDLESLGKSLRFEHFCLKIVTNRRGIKVFFADFALQKIVETKLPNGLETSGQRAYC